MTSLSIIAFYYFRYNLPKDLRFKYNIPEGKQKDSTSSITEESISTSDSPSPTILVSAEDSRASSPMRRQYAKKVQQNKNAFQSLYTELRTIFGGLKCDTMDIPLDFDEKDEPATQMKQIENFMQIYKVYASEEQIDYCEVLYKQMQNIAAILYTYRTVSFSPSPEYVLFSDDSKSTVTNNSCRVQSEKNAQPYVAEGVDSTLQSESDKKILMQGELFVLEDGLSDPGKSMPKW